MKYLISFLLLSSLLFFHCTENPFFKDNDISGNVIKGKVNLEGVGATSGVYVWLDGAYASTRTDEKGEFALDVSTSTGGSLMGQFNLFFYVNNYQPDSAKVTLTNGNVQAGVSDLNDNYRLNNDITLRKALDIDVQVTPTSLSQTFDDSLHLTVTLKAHVDTARITTKIFNAEFLTAAFLKKKDEDNVVVFDQGGAIYTQIPILKNYQADPNYRRKFSMSIPFNAGDYTTGNYELIPFIMVTPKNVPPALVAGLTRNYAEVNSSFINIPMVRNGGGFEIR